MGERAKKNETFSLNVTNFLNENQ